MVKQQYSDRIVQAGSWRWQLAIMATVFGLATFAPRPGQATLLLPITRQAQGPALASALAHGAALAGPGPAGGVLLLHADADIGWRALALGALAIGVPERLCAKAGQ